MLTVDKFPWINKKQSSPLPNILYESVSLFGKS